MACSCITLIIKLITYLNSSRTRKCMLGKFSFLSSTFSLAVFSFPLFVLSHGPPKEKPAPWPTRPSPSSFLGLVLGSPLPFYLESRPPHQETNPLTFPLPLARFCHNRVRLLDCFEDSRWLKNFHGMQLVPLEILFFKLSIHMWIVKIRVRIHPRHQF